jgi:hypothetical protein
VTKSEAIPSSLDELRKRTTFEQAEGIEPLPSQLKLKELSSRLRALLWDVIYDSLKECRYNDSHGSELLDPWGRIFYSMHVYREHRMADEFENDFYDLVAKAKDVITSGNYANVFGWIQYVLRFGPPSYFAENVQSVVETAIRRG